MVITTRRVEQLREECDAAGIPWSESWGRLEYMDALRVHFGAFDATTEIDPMKAKDLKSDIRWELSPEEGRYKGIAQYLNEKHVAEPKLDGVRMRLFMGLTGNTLNSGRRSVKTYAYTARSDNFPHLRDAVVPELAGTIIDCELLAPSPRITTESGIQTNSLLNASVAITNCAPAKSQAVQRRHGKAQLWVFDVLATRKSVDSDEIVDTTTLTYSDRRRLLERIVPYIAAKYPDAEIYLIPAWEATEKSITRALREGYEGVMLKTLTGTYEAGKRSKHWLKVKTFSTADSFICGYNPGENANLGMVGSLDLAVYEKCDPLPEGANTPGTEFVDDAGQWWRARAVAQVGNLTRELRLEMTAEDGSLKPEWYGRVVEWMAQGIGKNGRARHASLTRLRPDKTAVDCLEDQLDVFPAV